MVSYLLGPTHTTSAFRHRSIDRSIVRSVCLWTYVCIYQEHVEDDAAGPHIGGAAVIALRGWVDG